MSQSKDNEGFNTIKLNQKSIKNETLSLLLCGRCKSPLNPPIYATKNDDNVCSKCKEQNAVPIRNKFLEHLAEKATVYCKYRNLGCKEMVNFKDAEEHTELCLFAKKKCSCREEVPKAVLFDHLIKKHILREVQGNSLTLIKGKLVDFYKILHGNKTFIVNIGKVSDQYTVAVCINEDLKEVTCEITVCHGSSVTSEIVAIGPIWEPTFATLRFASGIPQEVNLVFNFDGSSKNDAKLKDSAKCTDCKEVSIVGIIQCLQGHIMCLKCRKNLSACPECKESLEITSKNKALEELLSHVKIACKNADYGCFQQGTPSNLVEHEKVCKFKLVKCLDHKKCHFENKKSLFVEHFLKEHDGQLLENFHCVHNSLKKSEKYIVEDFGEIFLFKKLVYEVNGIDYWSVICGALFSSKNFDNFEYQLTVFDSPDTPNKPFLSLTSVCSLKKEDSILIPLKSLEKCCRDSELISFKIEILKLN